MRLARAACAACGCCRCRCASWPSAASVLPLSSLPPIIDRVLSPLGPAKSVPPALRLASAGWRPTARRRGRQRHGGGGWQQPGTGQRLPGGWRGPPPLAGGAAVPGSAPLPPVRWDVGQPSPPCLPAAPAAGAATAGRTGEGGGAWPVACLLWHPPHSNVWPLLPPAPRRPTQPLLLLPRSATAVQLARMACGPARPASRWLPG